MDNYEWKTKKSVLRFYVILIQLPPTWLAKNKTTFTLGLVHCSRQGSH